MALILPPLFPILIRINCPRPAGAMDVSGANLYSD